MARLSILAVLILGIAAVSATKRQKCGDPFWGCCSAGKCNKGLTCVGRGGSSAGGCFRSGCGAAGEKCCTNRAVKDKCKGNLLCGGGKCNAPAPKPAPAPVPAPAPAPAPAPVPAPGPAPGPLPGAPVVPGVPGVPGIPGAQVPGLVSTANTAGTGASTSGSGTSTTTGNTNTFTSKLPGVALGLSKVGTQVTGGSGPTAGSVSTRTSADVRAPGTLNFATGSGTAGFGANGNNVNGQAFSTDSSIATLGAAGNRVETGATVSGSGPVATGVNFNSFALDP